MRLDNALKLYIGLYVVCFLFTWLVSVPMLIMVTPQSECLLFVTPYVRYGSAASKSSCSHESPRWFAPYQLARPCYAGLTRI